MTYADFDYYSGSYMGAVSENDFPRLVVRAGSFLDYYTRNKAKDHADLDAVKMCCCALVDKYAVIEAAQARGVGCVLQSGGHQPAETLRKTGAPVVAGLREAAALILE